MECARAKAMPPQALVTTVLRAVRSLERKRANTPVKDTSVTPAGTPVTQTMLGTSQSSPLGHCVQIMRKRGHRGHSKKKSKSSRQPENQASRTLRCCSACEMYLCRTRAKFRKGTFRKRHSLSLGITIGKLLPPQTKWFLSYAFLSKSGAVLFFTHKRTSRIGRINALACAGLSKVSIPCLI